MHTIGNMMGKINNIWATRGHTTSLINKNNHVLENKGDMTQQ